MGILNVTPDSFSDGGKFDHIDAALAQARVMVTQGASIIDVGGESTRPGASRSQHRDEIDRVRPVIEALSKRVFWFLSTPANPESWRRRQWLARASSMM